MSKAGIFVHSVLVGMAIGAAIIMAMMVVML